MSLCLSTSRWCTVTLPREQESRVITRSHTFINALVPVMSVFFINPSNLTIKSVSIYGTPTPLLTLFDWNHFRIVFVSSNIQRRNDAAMFNLSEKEPRELQRC